MIWKAFYRLPRYILCLAFILPARPLFAQETSSSVYEDRAGGPHNRIEVRLLADRAPGVGGLVTLTLIATPALAAPNLQIEWLLPSGVELLGGPATESLGTVAAGQQAQQVRQARFPNPGLYKVMVRAGYSLEPALHFSALGVLFFTVRQDGVSSVSDRDPAAHSAMGTLLPTEVITSATAATRRTPDDDPCFVVSGRVMRKELTPTQNGDAANPRPLLPLAAAKDVPVRFAHIEMREEDILFDDSYRDVTTDANGNYAFNFCDDDGLFDDELELYVRLHAEIDFNGADVVSVEDDGIIDDVYEFNSRKIVSEGGSYTVNFNLDLNQSSIMNIADAIFDAWTVWNNSGGAQGDDAIFDGEAEVHYELGDGVQVSHYNGYFLFGSNILNNDDISIADDASNPDPWDDSVIIHEWAHMADDYYGCDDNAGGPHYIDTLVSDLELAWGEGYPNYYQSAVRSLTGHSDASWYLDVDGSGTSGIAINLESYDATRVITKRRPDLLSDYNELAIAAMLWDLFDNNNDPRTTTGPWDRVAYGHAIIQEIYTDPFFESNGDWFDDTCTCFVYLWSWAELGKPVDVNTAEAIIKNIGRSSPFAISASTLAHAASATVDPNPNQIDPRWWQRLTLVADNSASMADSGKLDAVKTAIHETVNNVVAPDPKGVDVRVQTFNNASPNNQMVLEGQFFPEGITPVVDAISTITAPDPGCPQQVNALATLQQAIQGEVRGQVWLYTDSDTSLQPSLPVIKQQLNQQQMRSSFVLLGGCTTTVRSSSDASGAEEEYLQLAADGSQPIGIVPYLLTALGSGGQFLYVNKDQLGDAVAILRAQLATSAGAGRWSDYVSDFSIYRYDKLSVGEYNWIPATQLQGEPDGGSLGSEGAICFDLPGIFMFYQSDTRFEGADHSRVCAYENGYLLFSPDHIQNPDPVNKPLSEPDAPSFGLFPFWDDLEETCYNPFVASVARDNSELLDTTLSTPATSPDCPFGDHNLIFTNQVDDWFVIMYSEATTMPQQYPTQPEYFEVLLNMRTGEIRFQYGRLSQGVGGATLGIKGAQNAHIPVQISHNSASGATTGMGYKFVPAPPQPTHTKTIPVDALMDRIGFLQTGYSGDFAPMLVTDPLGNPVNCADSANVLCLTIDHNPGDRMVQYVQVNVQGKAGQWRAVIDAGASGQATFSFNALATSALVADSPSQRWLPSIGTLPLLVNLGQTTQGNLLTGWFQTPNGQPLGGEFTLYDDGTHGDGRAGDGRFGLPDLVAPGQGVGYLVVTGVRNGVGFTRSDPVPFNFQPLQVTAPVSGVVNNNQAVALSFQVTNLAAHDLCVDPDVTLPAGWSAHWNFDSSAQMSRIATSPESSTPPMPAAVQNCHPVIRANQAGQDGATPAMAFDGNTSTFFKSSHHDWQYIEIDFNCLRTFSAIRRYMSHDGVQITGNRGHTTPAQGEGVAYSLDGVNWIDLTGSATHGWENYVNYVPHAWHTVNYGWSAWLRLNEPVQTRYLRFKWDGDFDAVNEIEVLGCLSLAAGQSKMPTLTLFPSWLDAPSGQTAELTVSFAETEEGAISASDSVTLLRHRPPATLTFDRRSENLEIRSGSSEQIPLRVDVVDEQGYPVADGTPVEVTVTSGSIMPAVTTASANPMYMVAGTRNGHIDLYFTPPTGEDDVVATAKTGMITNTMTGVITDTVTLHVRRPAPEAIRLGVTPAVLSESHLFATLMVTVTDAWGDPAANALVRIGVSDDEGAKGLIAGSEVITVTTNTNGQVQALFSKSEKATGTVTVRAELLFIDQGASHVMQEDHKVIRLEGSATPPNEIHLPLIIR